MVLLKNVSDIIEGYLKELIGVSPSEHVDVRRNELAERFGCVPSQVNYVIKTRFTLDKGFIIQSKRGGGGYIRIVKVPFCDRDELFTQVLDLIGEKISENRAENLLLRLFEEKMITARELKLMLAALARQVLAGLPSSERDMFRAKLLAQMIHALRGTR